MIRASEYIRGGLGAGGLGILLALGFLIPQLDLSARPRARAPQHPATRLLMQVPIGSSASKVEKVAKRLGFSVQVHKWDENRGMANGLLLRPDHLKLLNELGLSHPYFQELPDKGPTFVVLTHGSSSAVYGLMGGSVWSAALGVPLGADASVDISNPERIGEISRVFAELRSVCASYEVTRKDPYGNPITFSGEGCAKGKLFARYDPTKVDSLSILVYPKTAARVAK